MQLTLEQYNPYRVVGKEPSKVDIQSSVMRRCGASFNPREFKLSPRYIAQGITEQLILVYEPQYKQFRFINHKKDNNQIISKPYPINIQWSNCEYELHYFNRTSKVCLVQKDSANKMLRLSYFSFSIRGDEIEMLELTPFMDCYEPQFNISKVDNYGKIAWYGTFQRNLNIKLYEEPSGMKEISVDLAKLSPMFEGNPFKVLSIWQQYNFLYVAIAPKEKDISYDDDYSPILLINLQSEDNQTSFSSVKLHQTLIQSSITSCINLQDYAVIQTGEQQDAYQIFVFDKEIQQIVLQEKVPVDNFQRVYENNYIGGSKQQGKEGIIYEMRIVRENYLPYQKILELLQIAQTFSKNIQNAILILGEDKTGKSMARQFLSGNKLIHTYNEENGFYEIITDEELTRKEAIDDRERAPWINLTQSAAIIDIPDWNQSGDFYKNQIMILFARLFKIFKKMHVIITIPFEYIEQSEKNELFFRSVIDILGEEEGIENFISIMLTKVDSVEQNLQSFQERIEQISSINEASGSRLQKISEDNRILCFENREIKEGQGKEMLTTILSFNQLSFNINKVLIPQQTLSEPSSSLDLILYESQFYIRMVNGYLQKIVHKLCPTLFNYINNIIKSHISHITYEEVLFKTNQQELALAVIKALAKLKRILTKAQEQIFESINELKGHLLQIVRLQIGQEVTDEYYFHQIILAFIAVMKNSLVLPLQRTIGKESTTLATFINILETESDGVLEKTNISLITNALQQFQSVSSSSQIKQFVSKGGRKIKRVVKKEMTYKEQKQEMRRKKVGLQEICSLPLNALKLDLILQQLSKLIETKSTNLKLINFYLRQSSKICQYHKLYFESIYFLFVIPDFYGIELLIDEFVQYKKRNHSYENKKLLNKVEEQLVQRLLTLSRECVRDNLVRKLITLQSLSNQTSVKPSKIRSDEAKNMKTYLSNSESLKRYKERLLNKDASFFYQLKDADFLKVLSQKQDIIKRCREFEDESNTKKKFEDKEALRYILDAVPIPA